MMCSKIQFSGFLEEIHCYACRHNFCPSLSVRNIHEIAVTDKRISEPNESLHPKFFEPAFFKAETVSKLTAVINISCKTCLSRIARQGLRQFTCEGRPFERLPGCSQ